MSSMVKLIGLILASAEIRVPIALQVQEKIRTNSVGVSRNSSLYTVATIIAMDMRLPEIDADRQSRLAAINEHTEGTDVFVCTDRFADNLTEGLENVVLKRFGEEIPPETLQHPVQIQWWRLQQCYEALENFAAEHHHEYSFIFKTRIDLDLNVSVVEIARRALAVTTRPTAFVSSDYVFGGPPVAMSAMAKLVDEVDKYSTDRCGCPYTSDEIDLMFASDWSAARFDCLNFPLVPYICSLSIDYVADGPPWHKTNLRSILMENATALKEMSQQEVSCGQVNICDGRYGEEWKGAWWESERAMTRHLLSHGVLIKELPGVKVTFLSWNDHRSSTEFVEAVSNAKESFCKLQ